MSTAAVRRATLDDVESLARLEAEVFAEGAWSLDSLGSLFESHQAPTHLVFVPQAACGDIAAYAAFSTVLDEAELLRVAVRPASRRQGLAHELLSHAFDRLAEMGVAICHLEVRADNDAALGLYRRLGFEQVGRRRGYYRDGCDALLLVRS